MQEWEKEFDEKFVGEADNCFGMESSYIEEDNPKIIKAFISNLLAKQKEELRGKVEQIIFNCECNHMNDIDYCEHEKKILSLFSEEKVK